MVYKTETLEELVILNISCYTSTLYFAALKLWKWTGRVADLSSELQQ